MEVLRRLLSRARAAPGLSHVIRLTKLILAAELSHAGKVNLVGLSFVLIALSILTIPALAGLIVFSIKGEAALFMRDATQIVCFVVRWTLIYLAGSVLLVLCGERANLR